MSTPDLRLAEMINELLRLESERAIAPEKDLATRLLMQNLVTDKKIDEPDFIGIIGRCARESCDVHIVTDCNQSLRHIHVSESVPDEFRKARELINSINKSSAGILVYQEHFEFLSADGVRFETEPV